MSERLIHPVLAVLRHNGTRYAPDDPDRDTVNLTPREAKPLLALKVVGEPLADTPLGKSAEPASVSGQRAGSEPAGQAPADSEPAGATDDDRGGKIAAAVSSLDPEKDFTQSGTPKVKAVELAAGFGVSADEVAAAWAALQPAE